MNDDHATTIMMMITRETTTMRIFCRRFPVFAAAPFAAPLLPGSSGSWMMIIKRLLMITIAALGMMIIILYYRHVVTLLLGHWYEIMALYYVKSILTEISASRKDRRVLQKRKIIRIKFLSIWGMLQTPRYV